MFARPLLRGQFKELSKQLDNFFDIDRFVQIKTDPTAIGQNMMRLGATGSDNFVPHLFRKGYARRGISASLPCPWPA